MMFKILIGIKKLHDNLGAKLIEKEQANIDSSYECSVFPSTCLRSGIFIKPILSMLELIKESEVMSHCIHSYYPEISRGEYAAFKILYRDRATLGVSILGKYKYEID